MYFYIIIIVFIITEAIRTLIPVKMRNKKTRLYINLTYVSAVMTPVLCISLALNHIIRWDMSILGGHPLAFIVLLLVFTGMEIANITEIKSWKNVQEDTHEED